MDARKLKEGAILKFKNGFFGKKWKECYAVLFSDSTFCWYDKKSDSSPAGSVLLKDVVPYVCIGILCDRMPVQRPKLPHGFSVHHLVGIGLDPRASKVHWFLFSSDSHIEAWFTEIAKTLPRVENQPGSSPQPNPGDSKTPPPAYNPPPVYPSRPPPVSTGYQTSGPAPVYQNTYPTQPYPPTYNAGGHVGGGYPSGTGGGTTVIVQDRGGYGGGGYGGYQGSGLGFGSGLGTGLLMGSLMGYGLGSCWGGGFHHGYGGMGGYPVGYGGFGGGYVQDNDTYITNNYYGGDTHNTTNDTTNVTDDTHQVTGGHDAVTDSGVDYGGDGAYDGGYDFGGDHDGMFSGGDFGGNDFGDFSGGDFGGGDFGGGDFGGGDFGGGDFGGGGFGGGDF